MTTVSLQRNFGLTGDLFLLVGSGEPITPPATEGWEPIVPSPDSRIIYCSSVSGLDTNDGLSELTPKKSLDAVSALYRLGFPDHGLLKCGEEWPLEGINVKAGRSDTERAVLSTYGLGNRPKISFTSWTLSGSNQPRSFFNYIGIDFYSYVMDPDGPYYDPLIEKDTRSMTDEAKNVLFEDCKFTLCQLNVSTNCGNIKVRRCIIYGAYKTGSSYSEGGAKPSNFHVGDMDGYLILEDSVFYHGGWNSQVEGSAANSRDHNIYLSYGSATVVPEVVLVRNNIITSGASHGAQMRFGGTVDNNFWSRNAYSLLFGSSLSAADYPSGVNCWALNNVIQDGRNMWSKGFPRYVSSGSNYRGVTGMECILLGERQPFRVEQNVMGLFEPSENYLPEGTNHVLRDYVIKTEDLSEGGNTPDFPPLDSIDLSTNVTYHQLSETQGDELNLPDPTRNESRYYREVLIPMGLATGNEVGLQGDDDHAKLASLYCGRERLEWVEEYTANAINTWIRAGYNVAGNAQ